MYYAAVRHVDVVTLTGASFPNDLANDVQKVNSGVANSESLPVGICNHKNCIQKLLMKLFPRRTCVDFLYIEYNNFKKKSRHEIRLAIRTLTLANASGA